MKIEIGVKEGVGWLFFSKIALHIDASLMSFLWYKSRYTCRRRRLGQM